MPTNQMSRKESKALDSLEQALAPKFKTTFPDKITAPLNKIFFLVECVYCPWQI